DRSWVSDWSSDVCSSDLFKEQLLDALRVIQRGDLSPDEMRGPWAGEVGQFQFVPSVYYEYAVDFEGNGKRDLIHSTPDALASAADRKSVVRRKNRHAPER